MIICKKNKSKKILLISFVFIGLFACNFSKKTTVVAKVKPQLQLQTQEVDEKTIDHTITLGSFLFEYLTLKYPNFNFSTFLYISVKHQKMYVIENSSIIKKYYVSTAINGVGNQANSYKTPLGLHTVSRKIGDNVPLGGILESRVYNGKQATLYKDKTKADSDYVTSRILWLTGEEAGINKGRGVDSYNRFIYIHGTPEEGYIGVPASHGCIRMKNADVIELFDSIDEGIPLLILEN